MIVVDTNILAYLLLKGPRNEDAAALMAFDPAWAAPFLWRSEFRNLLAGYIKANRMNPSEAEATLRQAASSLLAGDHAVADEAVFRLVVESRCTAYDCEYVALAEELGTVTVTEDKELLKAFPGRCFSLAGILRDGLPA